ncbi:TPA: hypothetical protein ACWLE3_001621, partial [Escherichia coli]
LNKSSSITSPVSKKTRKECYHCEFNHLLTWLTMSHIAQALRLMTNTGLPDALRLPGLPDNCNILNFQDYVGRIRLHSASGINNVHFATNLSAP